MIHSFLTMTHRFQQFALLPILHLSISCFLNLWWQPRDAHLPTLGQQLFPNVEWTLYTFPTGNYGLRLIIINTESHPSYSTLKYKPAYSKLETTELHHLQKSIPVDRYLVRSIFLAAPNNRLLLFKLLRLPWRGWLRTYRDIVQGLKSHQQWDR